MSHSEGVINHDQSNPNSKAIVWSMIITVISLVLTVWAGKIIYNSMSSNELNSKEVTGGGFISQQELKAYEDDQLHSLKWIDQSKGKVQIPIQTAMQLTLKKYQH
jgi:uncharacterized protein affecting Mg2+/Co2+ transport